MTARHRLTGACGAALLLLLAGAAALAPVLAPCPPDVQELSARLEGPTPAHPLGRDDLGRDVLARLLWGGRISLVTGLLVVGVSGAVGVVVGSAAGFRGGAIDLMLVCLTDLLLCFPGVLLAVALVAVLGPRLENIVIALSIVGWVGYARLARGQSLALRTRGFVEAARGQGAPSHRLVVRHLLPNLLPPVLAHAALGLGGAILAEAGLSFLGLGVPPPAPSWGSMLRAGSQQVLDAPHLALFPGAAIFVAVLGANLLADGLAGGGDPDRSEPGF
ncbi:MAG: ABC transporter permease [Candidatus Polarisedimenticolia bacterium]